MFHASEPTGLHTPRSRLKTNGGGVSSIPLARSLMRCAAEAACAAIINAAMYEVRHTEMRKLCGETMQASRNDCKRAVRLVNILNDITRGYMSQLFLCFAAGNGLNWRIESPPHGYSHEVEQLMFATGHAVERFQTARYARRTRLRAIAETTHRSRRAPCRSRCQCRLTLLRHLTCMDQSTMG